VVAADEEAGASGRRGPSSTPGGRGWARGISFSRRRDLRDLGGNPRALIRKGKRRNAERKSAPSSSSLPSRHFREGAPLQAPACRKRLRESRVRPRHPGGPATAARAAARALPVAGHRGSRSPPNQEAGPPPRRLPAAHRRGVEDLEVHAVAGPVVQRPADPRIGLAVDIGLEMDRPGAGG